MLNNIQASVRTKLLVPIVLSCIAVAVLTGVFLRQIRTQNTELVGTKTASQMADELFAFRNFYSGNILPRAKSYGARADFNFAETEDLLPLPATLVKTLGQQLRESNPGTSVRYYSEYPFSYRVGTAEAELDDFDLQALASFEQNPDQPFYRLEERDGVLSMRYVVADTMQESCVACHNSHPDSLKTDWAVGDVRGGLEVVVPVDAAEAGLNNGSILIMAVVAGGLTLMAGLIWLILRQTVLGPIDLLNDAVAKVSEGDMSARVALSGRYDELSDLATNVNTMLDATAETLTSSQTKSAQLQESIFELLSEVEDVAEGDLTVQAVVPEGELGPVADSFNFMIAQLRAVIDDVQEATLQVSSSANEIQTTAEHLTLGSDSQASQILDTTAAIDEMSVSIQQVSENAALSATVGAEARENATQGADAVKNTIEGMERIRTQVQDTTKRIRRLGESSQRIGEIVELIDDIADRTSILALNAAIEADLAGDAGVSFAVVAEEVESLADRATQATQQITILIRNIQSEINEAITAMETTSQEAATGSELASGAGKRLQEIEVVSDRLSELINSISLSAKQQARGSETIARSMNEIAEVTQQTASGTKEATASIGNLAILADELRASVSAFKLTDEMVVDEESELAFDAESDDDADFSTEDMFDFDDDLS